MWLRFHGCGCGYRTLFCYLQAFICQTPPFFFHFVSIFLFLDSLLNSRTSLDTYWQTLNFDCKSVGGGPDNLNNFTPTMDNGFIFRKINRIYQLKVSISQNKFMKSSFLPKYEQNILRISALASKKWLNQKLYYTNYVK